MFDYPKPVKPPVVVEVEHRFRRFDRAMRQPGIDGLRAATQAMIDIVGAKLTVEERAAVDRYNAQVDEYNAAVRAYNARKGAEVQARRNARENAKIRQAACPRCYATHKGEC